MNTIFKLMFLTKYDNKRQNVVNIHVSALVLFLSPPFTYWKVQRDSQVFTWRGGLGLLNRDLTLQHLLPPKILESTHEQITTRSSRPEVFWEKVASNFIEITLRYGCSVVNLLHIFRTPFPTNTYRVLLLNNNKLCNDIILH